MGFEKIGLRSWPGRGSCGEIQVVDLGYPTHILQAVTAEAYLTDNLVIGDDIADDAHKGTFGSLVVVGGSGQMPGAVALAGLGALKSGCGRVFICSESGGHAATSAEMMQLGGESPWSKMTVNDVVQACEGKHAVVCGPGMGRAESVQQLVAGFLSQIQIPAVVDADALYALPRLGKDKLSVNTVITPHPGEAAFLLACSTSDVQENRIAAVKQLRELYGCHVVLKGAGTLIATPDCIYVAPFATPALAVPGSGDVLAGIIGALLAKGDTSERAAVLGVTIHGACAGHLSSRGNLASEIADAIPLVLSQ